MKTKITLSIIYVYYNTPSEIVKSVGSILKQPCKVSFEIIIVDNNSAKKIPRALFGKRKIKIIQSGYNLGFGGGCNTGARKANGKYLLFLNPDTEVYPGAIEEMLNVLSKKGVGVVGPRMISREKKILPTINSFISFPQVLVVYSFVNSLFKRNPISTKFWLYDTDRNRQQNVDVLSGACLMLKKSTFDKIGGFDERFFMYFEEQDLCLRIKKIGLKVVYTPNATVVHLIGKSLTDKDRIKSYFQKSRYLYVSKHFGIVKALITEFFLRAVTSSNVFILLLFSFSFFINTYKQDDLMLFIGDAARDFLAAKEMIVTGSIPLVGIPSSVTWLHQGPLSVYGIGLAFKLSNFNPIAPGILFGFIGSITSCLVYLLGKKFYSETVGVLASVFYATSPMIVVNARMPYHTSLIPFFAVIFFLILFNALKNKRFIPLAFLAFGLLLQVELSNVVVIVVFLMLLFRLRPNLSAKMIVASVLALLLGVLPFIIYEFINGPAYIKFPLWIANRLRLFFGLTYHHNSTAASLPTAALTIYQQISGTIFPHIHILGLAILMVSFLFLLFGRSNIGKNYPLLGLALWISIPLLAFVLHASPGTAYFGLLYPAIAILIALFFEMLLRVNKKLVLLLCVIVGLNVSALFNNDFFVSSRSGAHPMPPMKYEFGVTWRFSDDAARSIVQDANGKDFQLFGKGGLALYKTSIDPYIFLAWYHGGKIVKGASLKYSVYQPRASGVDFSKVIYSGEGGVVVKNE